MPVAIRAIVVIVVALFVALVTVEAIGQGDPTMIPACEQEDERGCYWDADTQGNGRGSDVVNR